MLSDKIFRLYLDMKRSDPRFVAYSLGSLDARRQIEGAISGAEGLANNLPQSAVRSISISLPPVTLQRRIVQFLDHKVADIDALIAKKERLVALLQKKRQTLITQAVTRGLDPNMSMKESGIIWVPRIPVTWRVARLKHLGQIRTGIALGREVRGELSEVRPYIRVANVQNGFLDLREVNVIQVTTREVKRFALQIGDVLMNEGGDNDKLGRGYVWEGQIPECLHQNHVFAVRLDASINPYWVNYATQAEYLRDFFLSRAKQSTNLASISATNLGDAPIILPPETEVGSLVKRLSSAIQSIDAARIAIEESIIKLREYRQTIITGAVTGKFDMTE